MSQVMSLITGDPTLSGHEVRKERKNNQFSVSGCRAFETFDISIRGFSQLDPERKSHRITLITACGTGMGYNGDNM